MIKISVASDIEAAIKKLTTLQQAQQLRFSVAKALTTTASQVQTEVRKNMPHRFTLRRQWVVQGIRMDKATKDDLTATVYSKDPFMGRQETGGIKTPKYDQNLAIPLRAVKRSKAGLIADADLPKNLGQASFTVTRGKKQVQRKGAGGNVFKLISNGRTYLCRRKNGQVELLYLLVPRAKINKALGLADDAERIVRANFRQNLADALDYAMNTAR